MTVARCNRLLGSAGLLDEAGNVRRRGLGRGLRAMHCARHCQRQLWPWGTGLGRTRRRLAAGRQTRRWLQLMCVDWPRRAAPTRVPNRCGRGRGASRTPRWSGHGGGSGQVMEV